jgi:alanine-glyoxylate transaminase / serine-glyoxylate transaminase / serine-pyruvate transaminase
MSGRQFLQIPGPTNVPDRVLRAMDRPVIDHRGPEFAQLVRGLLPDLAEVFGTCEGKVVLYPTSGTGAWEAALVNTLAPGDRVLAFNNGHFSQLFATAATNLGYQVDLVPLEWGDPIPPDEVSARLAAAGGSDYRAVLAVHNETSTGVTSDIRAIREAMDAAHHRALLIVDCVSSLGSIDFRFDEWGVDVALTGSQKGLMLPPGMGILCASSRAIEVGRTGGAPRNFFDWRPILANNESGFFPYTPATNLLFGLREALDLLFDEGLEHVYARHRRLGEATREAVAAWGLRVLCADASAHSSSLTAVVMPEGHNAGEIVRVAREEFDLALGVGLGRLSGRVFRIGHLGSLNDLELIATIAGVEASLERCGVPIPAPSGVVAAKRMLLEGTTPMLSG